MAFGKLPNLSGTMPIVPHLTFTGPKCTQTQLLCSKMVRKRHIPIIIFLTLTLNWKNRQFFIKTYHDAKYGAHWPNSLCMRASDWQKFPKQYGCIPFEAHQDQTTWICMSANKNASLQASIMQPPWYLCEALDMLKHKKLHGSVSLL